MIKDIDAKSLIKVGKIAARGQMNSSCPWIHYQPKEPKIISNLRKKKTDEDD